MESEKKAGFWKKNWLNVLMIALSVGILAGFVFSSDFDAMLTLLWNARSRWYYFVMAVACMFVFFLMEALGVYILLKRFCPKATFGVSFRTTMVGQFFNCTTPFSTGGQPMQIYAMSKKGVSVGVGTSVLLIRYVISMSVVAGYGMILMAIHYRYFAAAIPAFGLWLGIGLGLYILLVVGVVSLLCFPKLAHRTADGLVRFLAKIHLVKRETFRRQQVSQEIDNCFNSFHMMKNHKGCLISSVVITAIQFLAQFSITWFVYCAFGCPGHNGYWKIVGAQLFVLLISSYFPTPGATGASELSYFAIFNRVFNGREYVASAMLIWRAITFYLPIVFGSFFSIGIQKSKEIDDASALPKRAEPDKIQVE